jgi:hypothetical protein
MSIRLLPGDHGLPLQQVLFFFSGFHVLELLAKPLLEQRFYNSEKVIVLCFFRFFLMFHQQWLMQ